MQKSFFAVCTVIILLTAVLITYNMLRNGQKIYFNQSISLLGDEAYLLEEIMDATSFDLENTKISIEKYGKKLDVKIAILDTDGVVVLQTNNIHTLVGEQNPEVETALKGNTGNDIRFSKVDNTTYIYIAVPIEMQNKKCVLWLSKSVDTNNLFHEKIMMDGLKIVGIVTVIALIIVNFIIKTMIEPINKMTKTVNEIAQGNYHKKVHIGESGRFGTLAHAINNMSQVLESTIEDLKDRNTKLEAMANGMKDAVIAIDYEYKIILINPMCYKLFSLDGDVMNKNIFDVLRNEHIFNAIEYVLKRQDAIEKEFKYVRNKTIKLHANPILSRDDGGACIGALLLMEDVTKIRKLEIMRRSFVSNVTHELKTPLTSIRGFIETLKNGAISNPTIANKFLDIIDIEAERLYNLIQDILALSEIEVREQDFDVSYYNIEEITDHVFNILKPKADSKNIDLQFHVEVGVVDFLCNKSRMYQMLINLIDNAINYTEEGTVKLLCKKENNYLIFVIEDTGIGIEASQIPRIFERFYRVDKGRSRRTGGTGLGLSIVKHIVMLYKGEISMKSVVNEGTTCTVRLPYINN